MAAAVPVGHGCRGTAGRVPIADGVGTPRVGNGAFAVRIRNGRASSATVLLLGTQALYVPFNAECILRVNPLINLGGSTDGAGNGNIPLPIPSGQGLGGAVLLTQLGVADPAGALFGAIALSNAVKIVINDQ